MSKIASNEVTQRKVVRIIGLFPKDDFKGEYMNSQHIVVLALLRCLMKITEHRDRLKLIYTIILTR